MKNLKKLLVLALAMALVLALAVPAFAAGTSTLTIDKAASGHTYEVYQMLVGDVSSLENGTGTLSNITLGANNNATSVDDFLKAISINNDGKAPYKTGAELGTAAAAFKTTTTTKIVGDGTAKEVTVTDGYYLVVDTFTADTTPAAGDNLSRYMVAVVGDTTMKPKNTPVETPEKKVKNADEPDTSYKDANNVAIGDTVTFRVTAKVPDVTGYSNYKFIASDTMSKGLTYTANSVAVKIDGAAYATSEYDVKTTDNEDGTTKLEIVFKNNVTNFANLAGKDIEITYNATLNENAVVGTAGNPNKVHLEYSNNPASGGSGDEFGADEPKGVTPDDWTKTYTVDLGIFKYDGADKNALEGVVFTMTGLKNNDVVKFTESFTEADDGTYYKLKDGTYTTTEPNEKTTKYYDSTTTKYKLTTTGGTFTESTDTYTCSVTTNANGYAKFDTVAAGTYEILEISTITGYNMIDAPIKITVEANTADLTIGDGTETCTWTIKANGVELTNTVIEGAQNAPATIDVAALVNIANNQGNVLPSTGGIGTTIFYVVGGVLVLAAVVLLVTKKRMSHN